MIAETTRNSTRVKPKGDFDLFRFIGAHYINIRNKSVWDYVRRIFTIQRQTQRDLPLADPDFVAKDGDCEQRGRLWFSFPGEDGVIITDVM